MKPYYEKELVQSLKVERAGENELLLSFYVQPETMHYPSGVNYEASNGILRVAIDRCTIREACETMIKNTRESRRRRVQAAIHGSSTTSEASCSGAKLREEHLARR